MSDFRELTKGEEQIMHILWALEKALVKEIVEEFPDPKPAYNTVSTIVRILETKGFVGHTTQGKNHEYYPLISKDAYAKSYVGTLLKGYFGGSLQNLVSFFAKEKELNVNDIETLLKELKQNQHE